MEATLRSYVPTFVLRAAPVTVPRVAAPRQSSSCSGSPPTSPNPSIDHGKRPLAILLPSSCTTCRHSRLSAPHHAHIADTPSQLAPPLRSKFGLTIDISKGRAIYFQVVEIENREWLSILTPF
jgi:hypothetical protein